MDFLIVTGLSGAGKSKAIEFLEDIGYYCVDNIPPELIPPFYELCDASNDLEKKKVAVVSDVRDRHGKFENLLDALKILDGQGFSYKILFLEAKNEVIVRRYIVTRRKHPLVDIYNGSVINSIEIERDALKPLREIADYIIDTSLLSPFQLKHTISELFLKKSKNMLTVNCMSFGFKYGSPSEASLIFDVRCFPNPYYNKQLCELTGLDDKVKEFVLQKNSTKIFIEKLFSLLDFMLPLYIQEGKSQLVIAIGCTGGKHRSVAITNCLHNHLVNLGYCAGVSHRDIQKS